MAEKTPHPHFNDGGTLHWYTRWDDASAAARAEGKLVFVEMGRELCSQCRSLVQGVVPLPTIAPLLQEHFVALASDADAPEQPVIELAMQLENAMMLPFVFFADADGNFKGGSSGFVDPDQLEVTLQGLVGSGLPGS